MENVLVKKIKKIGILILICSLIVSCSSDEYIDNQKIIDSIDSLEISKKITKIETDSIGSILDTIAIEYLKYDEQNRKRFKKRIYWYNEISMTWTDYFNIDENLFYREIFDEEGNSISIFETISNSAGTVVKAIQISKEIEPFDTTNMDYSYKFYTNQKVKRLLIKTFHEETGEIISKVEYDRNEKPLFEVMIMENDTMSFQLWEYSDTSLIKSTYTNYQKDTSKHVYYFDGKETLIKEHEFDFKNGKFHKSKEIKHFYNQLNEKIKSIERNLGDKKVKFIEYLEEK